MCPPIPAHTERPIRNNKFASALYQQLVPPAVSGRRNLSFLWQMKNAYISVDVSLLISSFLSSRAASGQVLSAFMSLTTVFGMGTGVSS